MRRWLPGQRAAHTRIRVFKAILPAGETERRAPNPHREAFVLVRATSTSPARQCSYSPVMNAWVCSIRSGYPIADSPGVVGRAR